jgi:1-acyl-sn-glycerol-3-phosphate acyltransferase
MSDNLDDVSKGTARPYARALVRWPIYALLWLIFHMRVSGVENLPKTGPYILVANHLHNLDPLMAQMAIPRNTHFFVKKELFNYPIISRIALWSGGFPVDRGTPDRWAIRRAEAALKQGHGVGIYVEGTRSTTLALQQGLPGAGLLAVRNDVPIIPLVITGSERLPFNGKKTKLRKGRPLPNPGHKGVRLTFGEPFSIQKERNGKRVGAADATEQIMMMLARMLPPDYRGVYAERVLAEESEAAE